MSLLDDLIKNSQCFGRAYDSSVSECKSCDVKLECSKQCTLNYSTGVISKPNPATVATVKDILEPPSEKKTTSKKVKNLDNENSKKETSDTFKTKTDSQKDRPLLKDVVKHKKVDDTQYDSDMPVFKSMSMEELLDLAIQRGATFEQFDKYSQPPIKRMRLVMYLKSTYKKK